MTTLSFALVISSALAAPAAKEKLPAKVAALIEHIKREDIRVVTVKKPAQAEPDACTPTGEYYEITVKVRKQTMGNPSQPAQFVWEKVRTMTAEKDGRRMEVCQE